MTRAHIEQRIDGLKVALRRAEDQVTAIRGGIAELELLLEDSAAPAPEGAPLGLDGPVAAAPPE